MGKDSTGVISEKELSPHRDVVLWSVAGLCLSLLVGLTSLFIVKWLHLSSPAQLFYEKVMTEIRPGDSKAVVMRLCGETKVLKRDGVPSWVSSSAASQAAAFPDGLEPDDEFLYFPVKDERGNQQEWYFQFRNDMLVNFNPADYPATYKQFRAQFIGLAR
jgi:hypothetical protein